MARQRWKAKHTTQEGLKVTLRSGLEKRTATFLETRKIPYEYETETLTYTIPEKKHKYTPDFKLPNGIYVECKGRWDTASRQKMALVVEQNPDKDIRMLFQRDNTITKASKTKYSDWCSKRNIIYHVSPSGEMPDSWLELPNKNKKRRKKLDD